jgi:hypothetical protein
LSLKAIAIAEAVCLIGCDKGIDEVLDVAIHDMPEAELRSRSASVTVSAWDQKRPTHRKSPLEIVRWGLSGSS